MKSIKICPHCNQELEVERISASIIYICSNNKCVFVRATKEEDKWKVYAELENGNEIEFTKVIPRVLKGESDF